MGNPKQIERDALRVQHPEDVMIRHDEQGGGLRKTVVLRKQARVDVTVRANKRQGSRFVVNLAGRPANGGVRIEEPVLVQLELTRLRKSAR